MKKALLLILCSMLFMWSLYGTQINILSEIFKSTSCPYCPSAQLGLEQLYDGHPNVIPITWYTGSSVVSPHGSQRLSWYGGSGVPDARFAGNVNVIGGGGTTMYSTYLQRYNQIFNRVSPLEITPSLGIENNQYLVSTDVNVTANISETNLKLITVLTKHTPGTYRFLAVAYHEQTFSLNQAGQTQNYTASFDMNSSWPIQDIKAVVFVQTWAGDKKVLQSAQTGFTGTMAIFSTDINSGPADLTVNFTDYSLPVGGLFEWHWDFDNDGVIDSYDQNPSYTYTQPGTYSVKLTVSDGVNSNTTIKENMITVLPNNNISGTVQGLWKPEYGVYQITGDIELPETGTLTIMPGTHIQFADNTKFTVNGVITAEGSESAPIIFDSDSQWKGIVIDNVSEVNSFKFCHFSKANSSAIKLNSSTASVQSSFFTDNHSSSAPAAMDLTANSSVSFMKNYVANNNSTLNSGAIQVSGSTLTMKNNIIVNNTGKNSGSLMVKNNSTCVAINNVIVNNNNTNTPGGQILNTSSNVTIENSIIRGSSILFTSNGTNQFNYCNVSGGMEGTSNIDADPLFVNPTNEEGYLVTSNPYGWSLLNDSPCIDSGNPDSQYNDNENPSNPGYALLPSLGTLRNDMGAYGGDNIFSNWLDNDDSDIQKPLSIKLQTYPNPFNPNIKIEFLRSDRNNQHVSIALYNAKGQKIQTLFDQVTSDTKILTHWNGSNAQGNQMPSGIYFVRANSGSEVITKKIIMLK